MLPKINLKILLQDFKKTENSGFYRALFYVNFQEYHGIYYRDELNINKQSLMLCNKNSSFGKKLYT